MLEQKLLEELNRYKEINSYGKKLMMEQAVPPPPGEELPPAPSDAPADAPAGDVPPAPEANVTPPAGDEAPIDAAGQAFRPPAPEPSASRPQRRQGAPPALRR